MTKKTTLILGLVIILCFAGLFGANYFIGRHVEQVLGQYFQNLPQTDSNIQKIECENISASPLFGKISLNNLSIVYQEAEDILNIACNSLQLTDARSLFFTSQEKLKSGLKDSSHIILGNLALQNLGVMDKQTGESLLINNLQIEQVAPNSEAVLAILYGKPALLSDILHDLRMASFKGERINLNLQLEEEEQECLVASIDNFLLTGISMQPIKSGQVAGLQLTGTKINETIIENFTGKINDGQLFAKRIKLANLRFPDNATIEQLSEGGIGDPSLILRTWMGEEPLFTALELQGLESIADNKNTFNLQNFKTEWQSIQPPNFEMLIDNACLPNDYDLWGVSIKLNQVCLNAKSTNKSVEQLLHNDGYIQLNNLGRLDYDFSYTLPDASVAPGKLFEDFGDGVIAEPVLHKVNLRYEDQGCLARIVASDPQIAAALPFVAILLTDELFPVNEREVARRQINAWVNAPGIIEMKKTTNNPLPLNSLSDVSIFARQFKINLIPGKATLQDSMAKLQ